MMFCLFFRQMAADAPCTDLSFRTNWTRFCADRQSFCVARWKNGGNGQYGRCDQSDSGQHDGGREVLLERVRPPSQLGDVRLKMDQVNVVNDDGQRTQRFQPEVHSGEIVGVAGISGMVNAHWPALLPAYALLKWQNLADGRDVTGLSPAEMFNSGLSYIPEERMRRRCQGFFRCRKHDPARLHPHRSVRAYFRF